MNPTTKIVLSTSLAACLAGCSLFLPREPTPEWQEATITSASEQILWESALLALEKEGYPLGIGIDRPAHTAESGWKVSLAPFKSMGWRQKATVTYEEVEPDKYLTRVRVRRETNEDILHPLDPSYAKWEPAADVPDHALLILRTIRSFIGEELELE